MALPVNLLPSREAIIKDRERERLQRYLFIKFGRKKFNMYWTDLETSYTNYSDIYIKYNLQTPSHQSFTMDELRMLRKGHAIHERGHIEYDVAGVTYNWREQNVSTDRKEWESNDKYPMGWLKYFSGMMVDVRMENFVITDLPEAKQYFDFCNYKWRFGIRGEHAGEDRLHDFRECLASRGFGLIDIPDWHPEAIALTDSVMDMVEDVKFSKSTQEGMDNTTRIVKSVWPTLWDWMVQDEQEEENPQVDESGHDNSSWGDPDEVQQNSDRVVVKMQLKMQKCVDQNESELEVGDADEDGALQEESDLDQEPDFKSTLKSLNAELAADENAADEETGPYKAQQINVTIDEKRKGKLPHSDHVVLTPFYEHNVPEYNRIKAEVQRQIQPVAAALKKLLDPTPDQRYANQRSGRLNVSKVWSASIMDDPNVFIKKVNGTPAQDARILVLDDCSGSTQGEFLPGTSRIEAMKRAIVLLSEATQSAKIPTAAYAFTDSDYVQHENGEVQYPVPDDQSIPERAVINHASIVFPLKPFGKLTDVEKGFIGGLEPQVGNRDTIALQWAVNELRRYRESIRLLIVLSDGQPWFQEGEDENTMKSIVQQAQQNGIDVICLFIGSGYAFETVKKMYPGGAIFVSKNLARDLSQNVMQIIKRRRR
ncbi:MULTISPECIES: hypothetical protein [unclassified Paenibacillus]|uniref:VWFA domain-containing protein n=2 Tax=Bacillati TaxID=1783272 RepID=A0ABW3PWZ9_9BACL|nr:MULTISPECIES: hypothetical protein [unclassified Paenibacillus]MCM3130147.1 hypothetical protein [Paenibacillus sp. MER 78]SDX70516.1 hypothetical protein SAMN05518848_11235 [Paenibacillus sp. PDC88]SFS88149.1 hypothetical protein SAMN04488601_10631 [Paenibacillus sp. 453mf]